MIKCPKNLIFSQNASACPMTCGNRRHYRDCGKLIEGCVCPEGTVLNYDVSFYLFDTRKLVNVFYIYIVFFVSI
jgi:hypothetical protein